MRMNNPHGIAERGRLTLSAAKRQEAGMTLTTAIGLMSGTSMDGVDIAVLRTDGENAVKRGPSGFTAYDAAFRKRIEASLQTAKGIEQAADRPGDLEALEREITRRHADAVMKFARQLPPEFANPEAIGFHGQTVLHRPGRGLTVQLGDGKSLARNTGIRVVFDMRANDMAHGGQGAPLAPVYHAALARSLPESKRIFPVAFVNIGGISNVTYVPETGDPVAFDSGPGNALIDRWVLEHAGVPFDRNGEIAGEGGVVEQVVGAYLKNPFFDKPGPKSLDRSDFTLAEAQGLELADGSRTLAAVTARAIFESARRMPRMPRRWVLCGGGRKNPHIVEDVSDLTKPSGADAFPAEDLGFDGDAMEAEAWAYLAVRSLKGLPLTFPTTTGCRKPVCGGVLAEPAKPQ